MSLNNGKLILSTDDITRLRNKAISLGLINPRDSGRSAALKLKNTIVSLALNELRIA